MNYIYVVLLSIFLLTACGKEGAHQDLDQFVQQSKQVMNQKIVAPAPYVIPKPIKYQARNLRSPFESAAKPIAAGSVLAYPTQMFPVSRLRFLGTITKHAVIYAYILAPDNIIYELKSGDPIGDRNGKIAAITSQSVEVVESTTKNGNVINQSRVTLQLKDEQNDAASQNTPKS